MKGDVRLKADGIRVEVMAARGRKEVVHGVGFTVREGEIAGIVGESGSGKSMTLRAVMGLLPIGSKMTHGSARLDGVELSSMSPRALRGVRGARLGFIPQHPLQSLHPILSIERQFIDVIKAHERISRSAARQRALAMLEHVGIADPDRVLASRSFELSGGMAQRTVIAMVLCMGPSVLLADEPTSALDVTVQRGVIDLLRRLCDEDGLGILLVTHDLRVVAHTCGDVSVFKDGHLVEHGATRQIMESPSHAYTRLLVDTNPLSTAAAAASLAPARVGAFPEAAS
jgi:ABC-type dipeptide/oligopeptide/nickel transport system ATPase component